MNNQQSTKRMAYRLRWMATARIAILSSVPTLAIGPIAVVIVGIVKLFLGNAAPLIHGIMPLLSSMVLLLGLVGIALPAVNRMMVREVAKEVGPEQCAPVLEMLNGLQFGSIHVALGRLLARSLETLDAAWWRENERDLTKQVKLSFAMIKAPNRWKPIDGPWVRALFYAIARCRRTDLLKAVERLEPATRRPNVPVAVRDSVRDCIESLRDQQKRDREAATLLRPTEGSDDHLLRAAESSATVDVDSLLRPSDEANDRGSANAQVRAPAYGQSSAPEAQVHSAR